MSNVPYICLLLILVDIISFTSDTSTVCQPQARKLVSSERSGPRQRK